jgi:hypothetical protein
MERRMKKIYEQRLDLYYVSVIVYLVTLLIYIVVTGTLIDEEFTFIWRDPIVYLLGLVSLVSLVGLVVAAVLRKRVVVRSDSLLFATRFKERAIPASQIEWITITRGSRGKVRQGRAERAARMKLSGRRRRLWIRPSLFEEGDQMIQDIHEWAKENGVEVRAGRKGGGS